MTMVYSVPTSPANLLVGAVDINGDAIVLSVGKTYSAQFQGVGPQRLLRVLEVADGTAVAASDPALLVRVMEDVVLVPVSGFGIFLWTERPGALLVVNQVP